MARRHNRGLGSSASGHTAEASRLSNEIDRFAALTVNKARGGRCQSALMAYAEMQRAIGAFDANLKAGGKAWRPSTSIREGAAAFNDHCVRESSGLSGTRRRRRRK